MPGQPAQPRLPKRDSASNTPNLDALREADRQEHVERGERMGLTRRQSERHADADMAEE